MALTREQRQVANQIVSIGRRRGATAKEIKAAVETGLVEANLTNPSHGDGTSVGWRQETASSYPGKNRLDLKASINRFYDETAKVRGQYGSSGDLAAAVQRPAAQYRGRYSQRSKEAQQIIRGVDPGSSGGSSGGSSTSQVTVPGQAPISQSAGTGLADMLAARLQQPAPVASAGLPDPEFSARKSLPMSSGAPTVSSGPPAPKLSVADQVAEVRRMQSEPVPQAEGSTTTSTTTGDPSGTGKSVSGRKGSAVGKSGKIIGVPYQGTHTLGNWQSDHAVDIAVPTGTPILATEDGTIRKTGGQKGTQGRFAGFQVTLNGRRDNYFYAHLSRLTVKAGQRVRRGDVIGYSGSANGVEHLHFGREHGNPAKND